MVCFLSLFILVFINVWIELWIFTLIFFFTLGFVWFLCQICFVIFIECCSWFWKLKPNYTTSSFFNAWHNWFMSNWVDCPLNLQVFYRNLVMHIIIEGWVHHWNIWPLKIFMKDAIIFHFQFGIFFLKTTIDDLFKCSYIYLRALHNAFAILCG